MNSPNLWWKRSESYAFAAPVPDSFHEVSGPEGVAVVRAFEDGRTDSGWGLFNPKKPDNPGFMEHYTKRRFGTNRVLPGFLQDKWAFAFVMRSLNLICIDIDGKNGGLEHAIRLGPLPVTLAETSKSGDGYHLFYRTPSDRWNDQLGFAQYSDKIGIEQGVDIRAVGCVYHYASQRWNNQPIATLPVQLADRLLASAQKVQARTTHITKLLNEDDQLELLMLKDDLLADLAKPIPAGKRNNTLFAIGSQMKLAQIEGWEEMILKRALALGLGKDEGDKIVNNISSYA